MAHPFRKKWGQNFLVDNNLLDKIVSTVDPQVNDHILEIGPGEGGLSEKILPQVKEMLAIEIDPLLVDHLNKQKNLKEVLDNAELTEIERMWVDEYLKHDCISSWMMKNTDISRQHIAKRIKEIANKCKKSL